MPAPPPPPPMAPAAPPPPPSFNAKPSRKGGNDVNALLKDIRSGTKLKKTVTNDRSAPIIGGSSKPSNGGVGNLPVIPVAGLGGLRNGSGAVKNNSSPVIPVGSVKNGSSTPSPMGSMKNFSSLQMELSKRMASANNSENRQQTETKRFGNIQMELKKQMANDNRNRGPPPPTPTRTIPPDTGGRQPFLQRDNITNGFHMSQMSLNTGASLHVNQSSLHRKTKSNANLSSLDAPDTGNLRLNKPVINHGKPNLAPKPPVLNGKPNTLALKTNKPVSRTHSLKSPRSPSPSSPEINPMNKFGTVRNLSSMLSQTLANSPAVINGRPKPSVGLRPSAPPPSIPVPATPNHQSSSHTSIPPKLNKPNHAPPPPPPLSLPQAPSHAPPPPPPHKTQLNKPASNAGSNPPSPPPRHSSMRDSNVARKACNIDEKFKQLFHTPDEFPPPPQYKNVHKSYSTVSVKQAPVKPVVVA